MMLGLVWLVTNGLRWIHYDGTSRRCLGHVDGRDDEDGRLGIFFLSWSLIGTLYS